MHQQINNNEKRYTETEMNAMLDQANKRIEELIGGRLRVYKSAYKQGVFDERMDKLLAGEYGECISNW